MVNEMYLLVLRYCIMKPSIVLPFFSMTNHHFSTEWKMKLKKKIQISHSLIYIFFNVYLLFKSCSK
ncbi:hypothetical protein C1645_793441 [Glomus cerebriforme]|uniref:Uncharacterized protein n=1 Tax=Glomus cerebriforme TaxID=658196 RepID=A0A397S5K2_9GLOM|nr:hypothetical protein C1645_793441 [Glomus cerebriforme]